MTAFAHRTPGFNYRVAAVAIQDDHVLLHRAVTDDFWAMPGGRPEFGEPSAEALRREMREEIGAEIKVGRLLWVVENLFRHQRQDAHEIAFYFAISFPSGSPWLDTKQTFHGHEPEVELVYRWFPIDRLPELRLYPGFLRQALGCLPDHPTHVVHRDTDEA